MKNILYIIILVSTLTISCNKTNKNKVCDCCEETYTNIDSALKCISKMHSSKTTLDDGLFLIAFIRKDIASHQKLKWNIIKDQEIINIAQRNYLLITLDANNFEIPNGLDTTRLTETIKNHKEDIFFVITNQVLYPFADWTGNEKKEFIIDRLIVGNGP